MSTDNPDRKVEPVSDAPFLAELSEANPQTSAGECLSVFLAEGEIVPDCLADPEVVGESPAPGHWRLLGVDVARRQAYYARIEHSAQFPCEARHRVRGTSIYPPIP